MKAVIFCGGLGLRMREASSIVPKPMIPLGDRPLLWHLMKYYAHYGVTDFILCAGYKAEVIQDYFERADHDARRWVVHEAGERVEMLTGDMSGWSITIVDTGIETSISDRLAAAGDYIEGDDRFLATYGDGLTDAHLPTIIAAARTAGTDATVMCARPSYSCHILRLGADDASDVPMSSVDSLANMREMDLWINAGFLVLRRAALEAIHPGDDFAEGTLTRLAREGRLTAYRHEGFWRGVDTMREWQGMDEIFRSGLAPWAVWQHAGPDGHVAGDSTAHGAVPVRLGAEA